MRNPIISVIIPCYNQGHFINDAIRSVEEYRRKDCEIIIINDGSTDSYTINRLNGLKKEGYNVIFQENQGLGKTRNNAIKISKGKYILPLDADNKIKPEYLTRAIEILETKSEVSIVYSDKILFGKSNDIIKVGEFNPSKIIQSNYIDACAIFRKDCWFEIGGYDEKMPIQGWEDWDFWISAIEKKYKFFYIPEPLFFYRVSDNSMIYNLIISPKINELIEYIFFKHLTVTSKNNIWLRNIFITKRIWENEPLNYYSRIHNYKSLSYVNYSNAKMILRLIRINRLGLKYILITLKYYLDCNPLNNKNNLVFFLLLIKRQYLPEPFKSLKIIHHS
jgi:glycosyltransferase involved in cell wall biosynthesis